MSKLEMFKKEYAEAVRNLSQSEKAMVEQTPAPSAVWDSPNLTHAHELYSTVRYLQENLGPVLLRRDLFNY